MSIDKKIDYVEQDGYKNYIKNSKSVTVPKEFKSRSDATPTKLAYITKDEAKMLKKMKKNTPHKGPSGVPSYDDYDAETGSFRSGAAMSAAESGKNTSDTLAAGMTGKDVQDIRSSVIAAGAGQRVNPGFFDSRNTVSKEELARARAFNPRAFRANRGGGIGSFFSGGGFFGNLIRGLGQKLGFGKTYNQPTYDMSQFNNLGLMGQVPEDFEDEKISLTSFIKPEDTIGRVNLNDLDGLSNLDFLGRKNLNDFEGINTRVNLNDYTGINNGIMQVAEITQKDIDMMKTPVGQMMDYDTFKTISGNDSLTPEEFLQLRATV